MRPQTAHDLKQLRTRLAKAEAEADAAKEETRVSQKRETDARKLVSDLKQQIERLEGKRPILTEHALLRYFERVLGYDLEAITSGLLSEPVVALIGQMPNGRIPAPGCRLVVKDGVVVTLEA
jgi:septal ring factor EnvC (AmiA/AmiB activator)